MLLVFALLLAAAPADATNLVLMIGDGFGPASVTLGRECAGRPLVLDEILVGAVTTRPHAGTVTDSAASATALATGFKSYNGAVGVDPDEVPLGTLVEAAELRGMATGLVTTTTLTHATPACFAAHVPSRRQTHTIATQMLAHDVEVLLGGGRSDFLPAQVSGTRLDDRDLLAEARAAGYAVVDTPDTLAEVTQTPVLGLFARGHLAYDIDRDAVAEPSLEALTRKALALLEDAPEGFVLVIEGGRIDHAGHANDVVAQVHDVLAFEAAVAAVREFVADRDDTLLVITADHETGGLTLGRPVGGAAGYAWDPLTIVGARRSAGAMARDVMYGADPSQLLAEHWNLEAPDADTLAQLSELVTESTSGARNRVAKILGQQMADAAGIAWANGGHTSVDVPLWAEGPGADRFRGHHDNAELGRLLARAVGLVHADATTALNADHGEWRSH